ncbi:MAG: PIN domain-containing protein [Chloroflexi bacterium]|nr:MAG: PIN domain-containing protein [Chloroflexota bacterium]
MVYVPDTHTLVWYLTADRRLGAQAKAALSQVDQGQAQAIVPIIVLTEILDLEEKGRIAIQLESLLQHLQKHSHYQIVPYTLQVLVAVREVRDVPELHDRIIVATAKQYGATVLSKDPAIAASTAAKTIW